MMGEASKVSWEDMSEAVPAFLTIILMPLTYSITNGMIFGLLFAAAFSVTSGKLFAGMRGQGATGTGTGDASETLPLTSSSASKEGYAATAY